VPTNPTPQEPGLQTTISDDGTARLAIRGDLDVTSIAALAGELARLADARPARLVIDMSGVSFVDCAAARLLASATAFLPPGQRPVLSSAGPAVRRLLQLTGLAGTVLLVDCPPPGP
jgi:anti-anti-sigma factor